MDSQSNDMGESMIIMKDIINDICHTIIKMTITRNDKHHDNH